MATEAERLRALAAFVSPFEEPGATIGRWVPASDKGDVIVVGWFEFNELGEAFIAAVNAGGWVQPFDWMQWVETPEGQALTRPGPAVDAATPAQLRKLLTAVIRSERFGDGSIQGAFESGLLAGVVRRAAVLAEAQR